MTLRSALLAAAALALTCWTSLTLCPWGAGGVDHDLAALARAVLRGEELGPPIEAGRRRDEAKLALAAEVIDGRMSLQEAAGHFRRLDEADPGYPPGIPRPSGADPGLYDWVLDSAWATLAQQQQRYAAAARWYAEAFAAHPHGLAGPPTRHRYHGARVAARAGCGKGRDAADLDEASRAGWRGQALAWLRAELEARRRLLEGGPEEARRTAVGNLRHWLEDPDFAGVRGPEALARLPAAERHVWQRLWAGVADTLARAEGSPPPEPKVGSKRPLPERQVDRRPVSLVARR
jgi:hypothetical protein